MKGKLYYVFDWELCRLNIYGCMYFMDSEIARVITHKHKYIYYNNLFISDPFVVSEEIYPFEPLSFHLSVKRLYSIIPIDIATIHISWLI